MIARFHLLSQLVSSVAACSSHQKKIAIESLTFMGLEGLWKFRFFSNKPFQETMRRKFIKMKTELNYGYCYCSKAIELNWKTIAGRRQDHRKTGPQEDRTTGRQDHRKTGPQDHRTSNSPNHPIDSDSHACTFSQREFLRRKTTT